MTQISQMSITELAQHSLRMPEDFGYYGPQGEMFVYWGFCGIDKHGASDILMQSNYHSISQKLMEEYPDSFRIESFKHWAVGYVDRLCVRILENPELGITEDNITKAFRAVMDIQIELEDYPIYDEEIHDRMQYENQIGFITDLPDYLLKLIDTEIEDWAEKLNYSLQSNNFYDFEYAFPKDDEILEAAYQANVHNKNEVEEWTSIKTRLGIRP